MIITVLGKNPPGKKPPDSKPNPIPNLNLTLPLTPHRGLFLRGFFPDTDNNIQQIRIRLCVFSLVLTFCILNDLEIGNFFCLLISGYWACFSIGQSNKKLICNFVFFAFFCFLTLAINGTAGEEKGPLILLYHFHPLTNIQISFCNFACETVTYFQSHFL